MKDDLKRNKDKEILLILCIMVVLISLLILHIKILYDRSDVMTICCDIRPCPFCDSNNVELFEDKEESISYIRCNNCGAHGSYHDENNNIYDNNTIVDMWNDLERH
jgi:hypothetical protein